MQIHSPTVLAVRSPNQSFRAKIKGLARLAPSRVSTGEINALPIPASKNCPYPVAGEHLPPNSDSVITSPSLTLNSCSLLQGTCDDAGHLDNPGSSPHFKIFILITSAKCFFAIFTSNIYRFLGIRTWIHLEVII